MADEIWLNIPGYNNYLISNKGKIWSKNRQKYKKSFILAGYYSVILGTKSFRIHRLVAQIFCKNENPNKFTIVNHKDGNRLNNISENLEWVNHAKNTKHSFQFRKTNLPSIRGEVQQIKEGSVINTFKSAQDAVRITGVNSSNLYAVLNGRKKDLLGYIWRYVNQIEEPEGKTLEEYDMYIITRNGKVFSKHIKNYIKGSISNNGYAMVVLNKKGVKPKGFLVHRLVATVYLDNCCHHPIVNHKNGNKLDNRIENLEWVSANQNIIHSIYDLKKGNTKKIEQYDLFGNFIATYESCKIASDITGYKQHSITKVARGERKSLFGYIWKFSQIEI